MHTTVLSVPAALAALRVSATADIDELLVVLRDRSPEFRRSVDTTLGRHLTSTEFRLLARDRKLAIFSRHFGVYPGQRGESARTTVLRALLTVAEASIRQPPQVVLPTTGPVRPTRPHARPPAQPAPELVHLLDGSDRRPDGRRVEASRRRTANGRPAVA